VHTLRVLLALGPFAVSFLRDRRRWIWWGTPLPRTDADHARRAERLVATIIRLGPTFVKMAQVFAARADLIPEPYLGELGRLIDQVPGVSFETIDRVIAESYSGAHVDTLFEEFERVPVAAASLGQVHRARYKGETVAVKVLRPHVERAVRSDLAAARRILGWVERWWDHPHVKRVRVVLNEFELRIGEEMDFRLEGEYGTEIRANFAGNPNVIVPRVISEMTRQRVLVMQFVEGTRIDRLDPARVDVPRVVATLVELYVQMMLIDGLFHADPHPGNLMVSPDGRIVLLDFGMTVRVPLATRRALMHTSIAAIRRDPAATAAGFEELGLIAPGTDPATVRWLADLLITNAYSRTTTQERIDALLADRVMKTLFDFPVILPQHLVYFGRTAALIEGVGTRYDPYFQAIPIASPVILRMRSRILRSLGEDATPSIAEVVTLVGDIASRLAEWVGTLISSWNGNSHQNGRSEMKKLTGRTTIALIAALSIAASASSQAAAPATLPTVEQQIAAAVLPMPKSLRDSATVMGYRSPGKLEIIRKGSNGMTCLALFAVEKEFHAACYQNGMEPFMARGRELRAQGVKTTAGVDSIRFKEVKAGKLKMPKQAMMYQIFGTDSSWDRATNKVTGAQELLVLYMPFATSATSGLPTTPSATGPWIMFPGTPKAHMMLSGSMTP
jgi:predicted unusual protein kinase regulating ubiquinone biosynthesis (AarF/ABC1/UbiB family)